MRKLTQHLANVNETYLQHCRQALSFALGLLVASLCCLVHALLPFLFENTASRMVRRLHERMVVNRRGRKEGATPPQTRPAVKAPGQEDRFGAEAGA